MGDQTPGQDQIIEILQTPGAPPYIILDIGGSADLNEDGAVKASLDADGQLVLEDA